MKIKELKTDFRIDIPTSIKKEKTRIWQKDRTVELRFVHDQFDILGQVKSKNLLQKVKKRKRGKIDCQYHTQDQGF